MADATARVHGVDVGWSGLWLRNELQNVSEEGVEMTLKPERPQALNHDDVAMSDANANLSRHGTSALNQSRTRSPCSIISFSHYLMEKIVKTNRRIIPLRKPCCSRARTSSRVGGLLLEPPEMAGFARRALNMSPSRAFMF